VRAVGQQVPGQGRQVGGGVFGADEACPPPGAPSAVACSMSAPSPWTGTKLHGWTLVLVRWLPALRNAMDLVQPFIRSGTTSVAFPAAWLIHDGAIPGAPTVTITASNGACPGTPCSAYPVMTVTRPAYPAASRALTVAAVTSGSISMLTTFPPGPVTSARRAAL
jgi:hypothetical protein